MIQSSITYVFGKCRLEDNKTEPIFENSVEYPDYRRCTTASAAKTSSDRGLNLKRSEDVAPALSIQPIFAASAGCNGNDDRAVSAVTSAAVLASFARFRRSHRVHSRDFAVRDWLRSRDLGVAHRNPVRPVGPGLAAEST